MSHFAKVVSGIITQVIVAEQVDIDSGIFDGGWIQTSFNTRGGVHLDANGAPDSGQAMRANFAGVGYVYDSVNDVFYPPRPKDKNGVVCASWINSGAPGYLWHAPLPSANNEQVWDETLHAWVAA